MGTRKFDNAHGFTLIELLVALSIFAVGLLALASMQITAIRAGSSANRLTQEAAMAQGIMEQILSWRRDDARLHVDAANQTWTFHDGSTALVTANMIRLTAVYSVDADAPIADMATVTVTATGPLGSVTLNEYRKTVD